jgi:hypothetical protein
VRLKLNSHMVDNVPHLVPGHVTSITTTKKDDNLNPTPTTTSKRYTTLYSA